MGELSEECAVLASDGADEAETRRLQQMLQAKQWKGKYALPVEGTETENSSAVYRAVPDPSDPTKTMLAGAAIPQFPAIKSLYLLLKEAARIFGRNLYVGERQPIRGANSQVTLSDFKYFTYADTLRMVEALGRALDQEVGVPLSHYDDKGLDPPPKPMRVLGLWSRTRLDWRLLDFAGKANYRGIVTVPLYDTLGEQSVKHIIEQTRMEVLAAEGSKLDAALRLKKEGFPLKAVISFDEFLSIPDSKTPEELVPSLDDICTIIFTSGAYLSSSNRMQVLLGDSTLSYLPLAHIYQRGVELVVTLLGIRVAYYSGDMLKLAEDLFRNIRASLGGRIRTVCVGSAPMESQQLLDLQLYLSAVICEGWGMTETGISFLQHFEDSSKGTIGGPLAATEFKVVSLPELQYDARANPPRCRGGELLVRGPSLMKEYFLSAEKTKETIDGDGWLHTGDVVEVKASGAVEIIDRAKNVFKLAHGEYIAPERLENIYSNSRWVEQIFVYGDSLEVYRQLLFVKEIMGLNFSFFGVSAFSVM
ncbi:long chain acyl-CoA synthetase, putative [Eimeria brunetti]|uniref:Long chain acyl-CoA synthetase, putative n=1 Tax=Eimeria brunetti TaxID=51314 RepID=U6LIA7_9EIME|nr:long chain acyl-CoA synthetase, putative [Eimeria brunetti]